jgi:predicted dehydrogenase
MAFKIGVIGCGGIAFNMHGPAYRKYADLHDDTVLAACCDIDAAKMSEFKKQFGFRAGYTDYKEMLKIEKPDLVCLNVPVHLTSPMACDILRAGFPLILEKPPGRNREEVLAILDAAEKGKAAHMVAFNRRFNPVITALREELKNNFRPDEIQTLQCEFYRVNRRDSDFSTTAIHGIDTLRFIADADYEEIHFYYQDLPFAGEGVRNIFMQGRFTSGAFAQLRFCPMTGVRVERITVMVKDSSYFAMLPYNDSIDSPGKLLHYRRDKLEKKISGESLTGGSTEIFETNGFYNEDAAFFDAVKNNLVPPSQLSTTLQSVELEDCIRRRVPVYHIE